ncbi:MAG: TIGR00730 family Rossman fold protein [Paracoccaceae bacterium]|nr:TIGR00730 family Rossman fold protein [Paracoccaceae bacterium]
MQTICVFCGSAEGIDERHKQFAHEAGRRLAAMDMRLVYGGGDLGLMGILARGCEENGGEIVGIIPEFLNKAHIVKTKKNNHIVTIDMHDRKMKMFEMADAFVALPGGVGTLEELMEVITLKQLGQHAKPILIANIGGFWDPLIDLISHMRAQGFVNKDYEIDFQVIQSIEEFGFALREISTQKGASPEAAAL